MRFGICRQKILDSKIPIFALNLNEDGMKMFNYILAVFVALVSFGLSSCEVEDEYLSVPFEVHKSCVMRDAPDKLTKKVIYTQQEFDADFSYAIASEEDVNPVDFSSSFVVAVCGEVSNILRIITITEILQKDSVIYVKYKVHKGKELSYTMAPCAVASISKDYAGFDVAFYDVTGME